MTKSRKDPRNAGSARRTEVRIYLDRKISEALENLAQQAGIPELNILRDVDDPARHASTYRVVIGVIEWTMLVLFLAGAAYALCLIKSPA